MSGLPEQLQLRVLVVAGEDAGGQVADALARTGGAIELHPLDEASAALAFLRAEGPYGGAPRPDLVVVDVDLNGDDALAVLHLLADDEGLRQIPVVALVSNGEGPLPPELEGPRIHEVLVKPLQGDELRSAIWYLGEV